jgi:hypothetical protein
MKYTLYKPNSKNTGSAFSFEVGKAKNGDPALYVSMILQHSWNDQTKNGSFKENAKNPEKSATVKLSVTEAGELLSSFKSRIPYTTFHKSNDDTTIIKIAPWDKERKVKDASGEKSYQAPAFGMTISKNSSLQFRLPMEPGEVEALSVLLQEYIKSSFVFSRSASEAKPAQTKPVAKAHKTRDETLDSEEDAPF